MPTDSSATVASCGDIRAEEVSNALRLLFRESASRLLTQLEYLAAARDMGTGCYCDRLLATLYPGTDIGSALER